MHFNTIHTANVAQTGNFTEHTQTSNTSEIEHQSHSVNLLPPRVYSMLYHAGMLTDHANTPISKYSNHCILDNNYDKNSNKYINDTNELQNVNNVLGNEQHSKSLTTTDMLHDGHHTTENKFEPQTQTVALTPCVSMREFSRDQFATATQTPSAHSSSMCKYMKSMQRQHYQQQQQVQTNEQQAVSHPMTWNKWSSERNSEHCSKMTHSAKVNRTLNTSVTIGEDYGISPESHSVSTDMRVMQTPSFKPESTHDSIRLAYTQLQPSRSRMRASLSPPHTHRNLFSTLSHDIVCTADKSAIAVPVSIEVTQNKLIYTHTCEPPFALAKDTDNDNSTLIHNNNNDVNDHDDVNYENNNEIKKNVVIWEQLTKLDKEEILEILSDVLTYSNDDKKLYNIICNKLNNFNQSNNAENKQENHTNINSARTSCKGNNHGYNEVDANNGYDKCNEKVESLVEKQTEEREEENRLEQLHTPPMLAETVTLPSNVFNKEKENNAFSINVLEAIQTRDENDANLLALQTFSSTPHESTSCNDDRHEESSKNANICNNVDSHKKMLLCHVNALGLLQEQEELQQQQQQRQKQEQKAKVSPESREFAQEMHPCLQEYGNCRYPRTCPYALIPRNFCLNWLYNECNDGESCLRVHRLPRECPEVVQNLYDHYHCIESDNLQAYEMQDEYETNSLITQYDKCELVERITPKQKDMNAIILTSKSTSLQRSVNQGNTPMITFTNTPWQRNETRHICHVQPITHFVQTNTTCNDHLANTMSPFSVWAGTQNNGEAELNRRVYRSLNDSFDRACQMR